ncbi:unnamed protein product, partial [marine sediment metagenome]
MRHRYSSKKAENSNENKNLFKNSIYSFLFMYSGIFFQIITAFLIARLITIESWGVLILSTSLITLVVVITNYFPP